MCSHPQVTREGLVFERQVLGKHTTQPLRVVNTCPLPIQFRLADLDTNLPAEFRIVPESGTIDPGAEAVLEVTYTAVEARSVEAMVKLLVQDVDEVQDPQQIVDLKLVGEGYPINVDVK